MQKIFYINTSQTDTLVTGDLRDINNFIKDGRQIISVTPGKVSGNRNTAD